MSSFLNQYKRQPKIFIDLPSAGRWYPEGALADGVAHNLPVFGMTANDEIVLKTPDALFNGEATKQVIKSCIPSILQPGCIPTIDIDFILVAIRIATYGESIELNTTCPECETENKFDLNLSAYLEQMSSRDFDGKLTVENLNFTFKPLDYDSMTAFAIENYQVQRKLVGLPEDWDTKQKDEHVQTVMKEAALVNSRILLRYIEEISSDQETENDAGQIEEFIANAEVKFYNAVKGHIEKIRKSFDRPPSDVTCSNTECNHEYTTNVNLDYSSFFGN